ncbi:hypothetical protein ACKI1P_09745 [Streptomyces turgidiscabies]|uniref:hypothetical protein n=1 Tax=Streptomyces turgidiscabies TaxID=85558 RepID=UPI0038F61888
MGEYEPGMPVDLNAIDQVAQTATQGEGQIEEHLNDFAQHLTNGHRMANFAQGTGEGRKNGFGLRAIAEAIPEV